MELAVTLIIFAILIFGVIRKFNLRLLLLGESLIILLYLTITKGSVLGTASTGSLLVDCFAYIANYLAGNIGGVVLTLALVSAYVDLLKSIGATDALAGILCRGVSKVKSKGLVIFLVLLISTFLRTCIASGPAEVMLLLATFFPVMLNCGCSAGTACAAILIPNAICCGPADPSDLAAAAIMGIDVNITEWFFGCMLPVWAVVFAVSTIVFLLIYRSFDKDAPAEPDAQDAGLNVTAPKIYAALPLLPLLIMILFSPVIVSGISVDVNCAIVISLFITVVLVLITKKKDADVSGMMNCFCAGICDGFRTLGLTVLFATLFAGCLNSIGGMAVIADALMKLQIAPLVLVLILCVFSGLINIVLGSFFASLSIAEPVAAAAAAATGISAPLLCFLVLISCGAGCICSPVNPMVIILSEKENTMDLIKRAAVPIWAGVLASAVFGVLALG